LRFASANWGLTRHHVVSMARGASSEPHRKQHPSRDGMSRSP
jgi:hypothetical protein